MLRMLTIRHSMTLSLDEVLEYNEMVKRNTPALGTECSAGLNRCPKCVVGLIARHEKYCAQCGQRITFVDYEKIRKELSKVEEKTSQNENMSLTEVSDDDIIPFDSEEFDEN